MSLWIYFYPNPVALRSMTITIMTSPTASPAFQWLKSTKFQVKKLASFEGDGEWSGDAYRDDI